VFMVRFPGSKQIRANAHEGGTLADGHFQVMGHAHG
jgi:hypothetical protein